MRLVPRLIPTVIVAASLMLTVRVGVLWHDAKAALADPSAPATSAPTVPAKPAATAPAAPPPAATAKPTSEKFSPAEVELLQGLSKRRGELDARGEELDHRELLLKAAEQRVDEKIVRLQQLQTQLDSSIGKVDQAEEDRLKSLVHIYETMKPAEAAAIFSGMDMPALLELLTRMKDLKTAPILAAMTPDKARMVTLALAQHHDSPDSKTN